MLRLVSFNMDYHWACKTSTLSDVSEFFCYHHFLNCSSSLKTNSPVTHKQRTTIAHPLGMYGFSNYLTYLWYPPLYIAGPIMTFNDFTWQVSEYDLYGNRTRADRVLAAETTTDLEACPPRISDPLSHMRARYGVRPPFHVRRRNQRRGCLVRRHRGRAEHDWLLESDHSLAEGKHVPSDRRTALRSCQLLIPWRFFRLWALAGGIDPPENMVRCMVNNYSALGFWRSWHRSYNLWIVRYANLVQRRI